MRAALDFVRRNAAELRIDPERLGLLGEDAGADLAGMLATERPAGVRAVALIGGLYDVSDAPSPDRAGPGRPDLLVVHGGRDTDVPPVRAQQFCVDMTVSGLRCEVRIVDGAIHRAENWRPSQWGYKDDLVKWLATRLGLGRPDHSPYATTLQKDVVYEPEHGLTFDAWSPSGKGPFPAVVLAHGGGWEAGDKVTYITPLFEPLARAGFAWFSIDYRLTPQVRHPEQIEDLRRAVAYLRRNAPRLRIDPKRIAVVGESASGQMAALLATQDKDLAAAVSFYGVYDLAPLLTDTSPGSRLDKLFGLRALDDAAHEQIARFSPIHHVTKDMAPLLLIHGTNEMLWAQGTAMRDRLSGVGARHELLALEGAPHGMENWEGHPEWAHYKTKLVEWLSQRLGVQP